MCDICEKIISDYKKQSLNFKIDRALMITAIILLAIYILICVILLKAYDHLIILCCSLLLCAFSFCLTVYITIFVLGKMNKKLTVKDFFHFRSVMQLLKHAAKSDKTLLNRLFEDYGINTALKAHEAMEYYRLLLTKKSHKYFSIGSYLSITISVICQIFSISNYPSNISAIILFAYTACAVIFYLMAKAFYREICDTASNHAVCRKIDAALTEI